MKIIDKCDNSYGSDEIMTDCIHQHLMPCKRNCEKFKLRPIATTEDELSIMSTWI